MNESTENILNAMQWRVWSGFYTPNEVHAKLDDEFADDPEADEAFIRNSVQPEFDKKRIAEATWPATTDCDKLDSAFEQLNSIGIIAIQNARIQSHRRFR
jgi:hypothetical protein